MLTDPATPPRLLSVEDDPMIRLLMTWLLAPDFEVLTASSYHEALEVARQERIDLVLLDINLGGDFDGYDVLAALRLHPNFQATPILACTALASLHGPAYFLDAGFDGVIRKPFSRESLRAALEYELAVISARHARCLAA